MKITRSEVYYARKRRGQAVPLKRVKGTPQRGEYRLDRGTFTFAINDKPAVIIYHFSSRLKQSMEGVSRNRKRSHRMSEINLGGANAL